MNTKFTKGEWFYDKEDGSISPASNNGLSICSIQPMDKPNDCSRFLFASETESNAHLIAAAPAMYELLKKFLPRDEDGNGWDFVYDEGSEYLGEEVVSMLNKARGES